MKSVFREHCFQTYDFLKLNDIAYSFILDQSEYHMNSLLRKASELLLCATILSVASTVNDTSVTQWDSVFALGKSGNATVPNAVRHPDLSAIGDESNDYAWDGHYWLRAYALMAQVTGNSKYIDWGFELIDTMFYNTDRNRYNRGEIGIPTYGQASLDVARRAWCRANQSDTLCKGLTAADSNAVGVGWRCLNSGEWYYATLNDGMTTQGMLHFLATVLTDSRFASYSTRAYADITKIERVVKERLPSYGKSLWADSLGRNVSGSFYYIREDQPFADILWGEAKWKFYTNPVPYNHSAAFAGSLLLLDSLRGHTHPEYREIADSLWQYLKNYIRTVNYANQDTSYEWNYEPKEGGSNAGVEDVGHAHGDLSFLQIAKASGIKGLTDHDMKLFTQSFHRIYKSDSTVTEKLDGTGTHTSEGNFEIGNDWLDLIPWDTTLYGLGKAVFHKNFNSIWSRPMLMWANLIRWNQILATKATPTTIINEPQSPVLRSTKYVEGNWRLNGERIASPQNSGVYLGSDGNLHAKAQ